MLPTRARALAVASLMIVLLPGCKRAPEKDGAAAAPPAEEKTSGPGVATGGDHRVFSAEVNLALIKKQIALPEWKALAIGEDERRKLDELVKAGDFRGAFGFAAAFEDESTAGLAIRLIAHQWAQTDPDGLLAFLKASDWETNNRLAAYTGLIDALAAKSTDLEYQKVTELLAQEQDRILAKGIGYRVGQLWVATGAISPEQYLRMGRDFGADHYADWIGGLDSALRGAASLAQSGGITKADLLKLLEGATAATLGMSKESGPGASPAIAPEKAKNESRLYHDAGRYAAESLGVDRLSSYPAPGSAEAGLVFAKGVGAGLSRCEVKEVYAMVNEADPALDPKAVWQSYFNGKVRTTAAPAILGELISSGVSGDYLEAAAGEAVNFYAGSDANALGDELNELPEGDLRSIMSKKYGEYLISKGKAAEGELWLKAASGSGE